MTILAGILQRDEKTPISDALCRCVKNVLSRNHHEQVTEYRDHHCYLAKIDIGAYGAPGFRVGDTGCVTLLAGEPLLDNQTGKPGDRAADLDILQHHWSLNDWKISARTRGVFSAAHYDPNRRTLKLITDRLGIRPLYYWVGDRYAVFASTVRVLEHVPDIPKVMDVRAVTEIASFGFPLGNRTPYKDVFLLKSAEIVHIDPQSIARRQYWRWDRLPVRNMEHAELLAEAYDRFSTGINIRMRSDTTTIAFLSGGLDSRCIVGLLRAKDANVHTFNFGVHGSQDQVFAAEFANGIGSLHTQEPMASGSSPAVSWSEMMAAAWNRSADRRTYPAERPNLVWSGDGGSVSVGAVYMSKRVVDLMRQNKQQHAVDVFLQEQQIRLPGKLFQRDIAPWIINIPRLGVNEELSEISGDDPGRNFHLFLMFNDQRRHLANHFETIDLHRLEFHLPFFDGHFLELILSSPIDLFLEHTFYNTWLNQFPGIMTQVPWQSYPGHAPCPIHVAGNFDYQWRDDSPSAHLAKKMQTGKLVRRTGTLIKANDFPDQILRNAFLRGAMWITRFGIRNYNYVMRTALVYYQYWKESSINQRTQAPQVHT